VTTARENNNSYVAGRFVAANYGQWTLFPSSVPRNVTGVRTFTVQFPRINLPDGRTFLPFATNAPIVFGGETLTPSAVSYSDNNTRATITATFTVHHSQNDPISSATLGLQEALNDAAGFGGVVTVDGFWANLGGTTLMITDAVVPGNVEIEDVRTGLPSPSGTAHPSVTFNVTSGAAASPAAPLVLAPVAGTVSHAYFTTLTSDGGTDLVFNLKKNGTSVLSGSSATVAAGTSEGTVSTFALTTATVAVAQGDKWELDITGGTSDWSGAVQCY
jgi:hypothetical protein